MVFVCSGFSRVVLIRVGRNSIFFYHIYIYIFIYIFFIIFGSGGASVNSFRGCLDIFQDGARASSRTRSG